jgi:hypothetical protein
MQRLKLDPLEGKTIGHLTVVARASESKMGSARYFVRCSCGKDEIRYGSELTRRHPRQSCGCLGDKRWTDEEYAFLKEEYPKRGWFIADEMGRTRHAIRNKAGVLGLHFDYERHYAGEWTEADDEILRRNYANGGTAICLPLLPGRTKASLRNRAHNLGIQCGRENRFGVWTDKENRIMRKHYRHGWKAVQALLPERSRDAILQHARTLGLKQTPRWKRREERLLKKIYPTGGIGAARAALPGHSYQSIRAKIQKLNLRRIVIPSWTEEEVQIVRDHFPKGGSAACLALLPNKTEPMIAHACKKYGIRFHRWTEEEDAILRQYYPKNGASGVMPHLPQYTRQSIHRRALHLNIEWENWWSKKEDAIIRRCYPEKGSAGCAPLLPKRTREAIRGRANVLGVLYLHLGRNSEGAEDARNTNQRAVRIKRSSDPSGDEQARSNAAGNREGAWGAAPHGELHSPEESLAA